MAHKFLFTRFPQECIQDFPLYIHPMLPQTDTVVHEHDFVELVLILSGTAQHVLLNTGYHVSKGDILVIPRKTIHCYQQASSDFSLINILFIPEALPLPSLDCGLLPGMNMLLHQPPPLPDGVKLCCHCDDQEFNFLTSLAEEMIHENTNRTPGHLFVMIGLLMALLGHVARLFSTAPGTGEAHFSNISKVIAHLNKHYRENISIQELCKIGGMSRSTLQRTFTRTTGTTPIDYQLRRRISEAVNMMRDRDRNLTEIALFLGFSDCSYFSKQFRKIMGMSPRQFRTENQA